MTTPTLIEMAEKLSDAELEDAERCARESGWPDELYFGLLAACLRARASQGGE